MDASIAVLLIVLASLASLASIRIIDYRSRAVVVRLGRILRVVGPGVCFVAPAVDRLITVKMADAVPRFRELSEPEIKRQILDMARTGELFQLGEKSCPTCGRPYDE